jgi:hypothetical protein
MGYHYTVAFYGITGAATGAVVGRIGGLLMFSYLTLNSRGEGDRATIKDKGHPAVMKAIHEGSVQAELLNDKCDKDVEC